MIDRQQAIVRSHPSRGAWIEIVAHDFIASISMPSHPSRGAWIEIYQATADAVAKMVAPLTGCVD